MVGEQNLKTLKVREYVLKPKYKELTGVDQVYSALDPVQFNTQLYEIFGRGHYSRGLWKRDMVVLDIGANIGMASLFFRNHAKVIYALEPSPTHYVCLTKNIAKYPHIKPFNLAISDGSNSLVLKNNDKGTIPESVYGNGENEVVVPATSIDAFMSSQNIDHVDLLKIDVEGSEYWIFESDGFTSVAGRIDRIIGESHRKGYLGPDLIRVMLKARGFNTKILGFYNMVDTVTISNSETKKSNSYRVPYRSIFYSERI